VPATRSQYRVAGGGWAAASGTERAEPARYSPDMSQIDRVRSLYTGLPGMPGVTTMFFDPAEGLNPQDLVDRISDFWNSLLTSLADGMTITVEPIVDSINSDTGEVTSSTGVTPPTPTNCSDTADNLPFATQALVQLRTGVYFGGRELRGRYFVPGYCESAQTAGAPSSAVISALQAAAQSLADDADQIVYSPTKHEFADVSTCQVWNKWAVLRSRRD